MVQGRGERWSDEDAGGGQSAVVARRIRDQAKIRAADDEIALLQKAQEADELEALGQYDQAEQKLAEAQELGDRLALLEQSESKEQKVYNQSLSSSSARVAKKKKRKVSREVEATKRVTVYDFEDDTIDADLLVPAGTIVHDPVDVPIAGPIAGESAALPPPPEYAPEPAPEPALEPKPEPTPTSEPALIDNGVVVVGSTSPDVMDRWSAPLSKRQRTRNRRGGKRKSPKASAAPKQPPALTLAAPAPDPNAALAGPVVTASAVSVHVPAVGEVVLYQHMLLPEGKTLTVHLEARRHEKSKRKSK
jgi:hypothetical protein